MLALKIATTCHPSCLRSFESTGCSWLGPSLRVFVRGRRCFGWCLVSRHPRPSRTLIDPSACLMETCALCVPGRVHKQAHRRRSHRGCFKGCHQWSTNSSAYCFVMCVWTPTAAHVVSTSSSRQWHEIMDVIMSLLCKVFRWTVRVSRACWRGCVHLFRMAWPSSF